MGDRNTTGEGGHARGFGDAQAAYSAAEAYRHQDVLEIDRIARRIWRGRTAILLVALVFLAGSLAVVFLWRGTDSGVAYRYVVQFTFNGREKGEYPNGSPFDLRDLLTPSVLSEVHAINDLDAEGIDAAMFQERMSVAPFVADREAILSRYQTEYDKWITSAAELRELPDRAATELRRASQYSAMVEFDDFDGKVQPVKAAKLVRDVVEVWSRKAVSEQGVFRIDIDRLSPALFEHAALADLEPLNLLRAIVQRYEALASFVDSIGREPNGLTVLDGDSGLNIPSLKTRLADARISIIELPVLWSRNNIDKPDTARLPLQLYSSEIFDPALVLDQDYLVALDLAAERIDLLRKDVGAILQMPNGPTVTDPVSGLTAYDIVRLLDDLEELKINTLRGPIVELGISREPELVVLHYGAQLSRAKRKRAQLAAAAQVIDKARDEYDGGPGNRSAPAAASGDGGLFAGGGSTVIPQLGDGFIDRLIKLSEQGGDARFRQELTRESISLQREITQVDDDIARIGQFLAKLKGQHEVAGSAEGRARLARDYAGRVETELPKAIGLLQNYADVTRRLALRIRYADTIHSILFAGPDEAPVMPDYYLRDTAAANGDPARVLGKLHEIASVVGRIYDVVSAENLGDSRGLYQPLGDVEAARNPLVTRGSVLFVAAATLAGLLLGLAYALFVPAIRNSGA